MNDFYKLWDIYDYSFPDDEKRDMEEQQTLLSNSQYKVSTIYEKSTPIGFLSYWTFKNFIYLEHFAVDKSFRGKGHGTKLLKKITNQYKDKSIILEVEKPENDIAKRRIKFYKRMGFYLNSYDYMQPAYNETKKPVPLLIMSYGKKISYSEFCNIKEVLYKKVYKVI